jgi:hypothetical protein
MASEVEIYNLALGHVGNSTVIVDADEQSNEANLCRRFYATARDIVLRKYPWSFCTSVFTLGLIEEDPTEEWAYSYKYPANALLIRKLLSGVRKDNPGSFIKYVVARGSTGRVIYTDLEDAQAEITWAETDTGRFPIDFTLAISYRLAMFIMRTLGEGDPWKIKQDLVVEYERAVADAIANDSNEQKPDLKIKSEFERAREK